MTALKSEVLGICADIEEYMKLVRCCHTAAQRFDSPDSPLTVALYTTERTGQVTAVNLPQGQVVVHFPALSRRLRFDSVGQMVGETNYVMSLFGDVDDMDEKLRRLTRPTIYTKVIEQPRKWWQWRPWRTYHAGWAVKASVSYGLGIEHSVQTQLYPHPPRPETVCTETRCAIEQAIWRPYVG